MVSSLSQISFNEFRRQRVREVNLWSSLSMQDSDETLLFFFADWKVALVLALYCYITNYHKQWFKTTSTYYLTILQIIYSGRLDWVLCLGLTKPVFLSRGSEEESASKLIQAVGRIQFFEVVGLRFPLPCWLLVRGSISVFRGHFPVLAYSPLSLKPVIVH